MDPEPVSLNGRGFPLGVIPKATYETKYTPFVQGDLLLLHSDCLTETKNGMGDCITDDQIKKTILSAMKEQNRNAAKHVINQLVQQFKRHHSGPINDDFTINAFWRSPKY